MSYTTNSDFGKTILLLLVSQVHLGQKTLFDCNGGHLKQFQQTKSRLKLRLWFDCIFCFIHGKHVIEKSISVPWKFKNIFLLLFKKSAVNQIIIKYMVASGTSLKKIQNYKSVDGRKLQFIQ